MHVCREANLASSSSWMYIAYISLFLICFILPLCWWLTKRGRKILSLYMHIWVFAYIEFMHFMFSQNGKNDFESLYKKGEKIFRKRIFDLCMFLSPFLCIHICLVLCTSLQYLFVYCYAWVKGKLLWSLTLIHAYITPWVLSSSKRGRLLAQRPITLVLMMINSCSYSTNDLVFN